MQEETKESSRNVPFTNFNFHKLSQRPLKENYKLLCNHFFMNELAVWNKMCSPSSFTQYSSCRIIIDCTDIEIATPKLMSQQCATYSTYRGMNSFKVIIGVAPNAVITYVSGLYPGSVSDKCIDHCAGIWTAKTFGCWGPYTG